MATGKIRADTCFIYPYPRPNIHARIHARHPQRAQNHARTRYPRVSRARGHTRVPADGCRAAGGIWHEHGAWEKEGGRRRHAVWRRGWRRVRLEAGGGSIAGREEGGGARMEEDWRRRRCPHPAGRRRRRHHPYPSREEGSGARTQQGGGEGDCGTSWAEEEPRGWRAAHAGAWKGAAAGPPGRRQGQ